MSNRAHSVWHRLYADFMMPSRLPAFGRLLESSLAGGYSIISVEAYWAMLEGSLPATPRPLLVLRHDIDTDPTTGRRMWEIEQALGVSGSFFFRLSTLDVPLMQAIAAAGGHASYHYEELASVARRLRLHRRVEVEDHIREAQDEFRRNLVATRGRTGLPMRIVASHGDFVNRRTGVPNWVILTPELRHELGIDLETYDAAMMDHVTSRHADTHYPRYWLPENPAAAIARKEPVIYLLVHPRHWHVARFTNARDDVGRAWGSLKYAFPARSRSRRRG